MYTTVNRGNRRSLIIRISALSPILFAIIIYIFGYLGYFSMYRMIPTYAMAMIFMAFLALHRNCCQVLDFTGKIWILFFIYILGSALLFNTRTGFWYVAMTICAMLFLHIKLEEDDFLNLINAIKIISIIFAIFTFLNAIYPSIVTDYFKFMISDRQIRTIQRDLLNGGYPGLAGESSFNGFCMMLGLLAFLCDIISSNKRRLIHVIFAGLIAYAIVLTGKRSILLIITLVPLLIYLIQYFPKRKTLKSFLFFCALFILLFFMSPLIYDKILQILNKGGNSIQLSNREWFWGMAFELFHKHPLIGNGINTYDFLYNERKESYGYLAFAGAHNSYIQFLAELGIIGLTLFLLCVAITLGKTIKIASSVWRKDVGSDWGCLLMFSLMIQVSILVYAMSENPFYQPQQLFVYFLAVAIMQSAWRFVYANEGQEAAT